MLIEQMNENNALIVKLMEKRLDAQMAVNFKQTMAEFIEKGNKAIVLDLSMVEFIDSSGLGAIVSALKLMGKEGNIVLSGLQAPVLALFKLTRMDKVFAIYADPSTAAASL